MAYEIRDNSGSLFKNEKKEKETHPDYTGTAMIGGVEHFMDAWLKESDSGRRWMSFSFKPKKQEPKREPSRQERAAKYRPGADDMEPPF